MNIHKRDNRLDYIIYALSENEFMTYDELSEKVGGSPRTLRRDIRILKDHYWNIYTKRGNGGGIGFINCNNQNCEINIYASNNHLDCREGTEGE